MLFSKVSRVISSCGLLRKHLQNSNGYIKRHSSTIAHLNALQLPSFPLPTAAQIKSAYLERVTQTHPDRIPGKEEEFRQVSEAYSYFKQNPPKIDLKENINPDEAYYQSDNDEGNVWHFDAPELNNDWDVFSDLWMENDISSEFDSDFLHIFNEARQQQMFYDYNINRERKMRGGRRITNRNKKKSDYDEISSDDNTYKNSQRRDDFDLDEIYEFESEYFKKPKKSTVKENKLNKRSRNYYGGVFNQIWSQPKDYIDYNSFDNSSSKPKKYMVFNKVDRKKKFHTKPIYSEKNKQNFDRRENEYKLVDKVKEKRFNKKKNTSQKRDNQYFKETYNKT